MLGPGRLSLWLNVSVLPDKNQCVPDFVRPLCEQLTDGRRSTEGGGGGGGQSWAINMVISINPDLYGAIAVPLHIFTRCFTVKLAVTIAVLKSHDWHAKTIMTLITDIRVLKKMVICT